MLKADEDEIASLIQAHVNTFSEHNNKLEQHLHSFKTLVGFVVVGFLFEHLFKSVFSRVQVACFLVARLRLLKMQINHLLR